MSKVWDIVVGHALFVAVVVALAALAFASLYALHLIPARLLLALAALIAVYALVSCFWRALHPLDNRRHGASGVQDAD
jgi:hypothetical protein